jgi:hypothetical protein
MYVPYLNKYWLTLESGLTILSPLIYRHVVETSYIITGDYSSVTSYDLEVTVPASEGLFGPLHIVLTNTLRVGT